MQKIVIKYLGPIKELELEIKDFNLLIGEQATGKKYDSESNLFLSFYKDNVAGLSVPAL